MSDPVIRRATPDDAAALADLARSTFRETFVAGFAIPYPPAELAAFEATSFDATALADHLGDPSRGFWIAEAKGRPLGYAGAGPCKLPHPDAKADQGELLSLYVAREAQGLGLGVALLNLALDWMGDHYAGPQWLGVWSGNLKAQRLYAAHGFVKVGDYRFAVGTWLDDEFIYRRAR